MMVFFSTHGLFEIFFQMTSPVIGFNYALAHFIINQLGLGNAMKSASIDYINNILLT
jgi:hypothetical protein